jgi:hypothetical protein
MDETKPHQHAQVLQTMLNDIRNSRPLNTSGDVQAALEAAVTSLQGGGNREQTVGDLRALVGDMPRPDADVLNRAPHISGGPSPAAAQATVESGEHAHDADRVRRETAEHTHHDAKRGQHESKSPRSR